MNSDNRLETFDLFRMPSNDRPKNCPLIDKPTRITSQIEDWYVIRGIDDFPSLEFFGEKRIEEDFQKLFENDLTSSLNNLEEGEISFKEKEVISRFVAFQLHRTPISRSYYKEMQEGIDFENMSKEERILRSANIIKGFIETSISGFSLHPYLMRSKWCLLENRSKTPFITSDNPIIMSDHPSNLNFLSVMNKAGEIVGPELSARETAYSITISPSKMLYINTSAPTDESDCVMFRGFWDLADKVKVFNDLIFRSCLSCIYSNKKAVLECYHGRFKGREISQDLFVDDPWRKRSLIDTKSEL